MSYPVENTDFKTWFLNPAQDEGYSDDFKINHLKAVQYRTETKGIFNNLKRVIYLINEFVKSIFNGSFNIQSDKNKAFISYLKDKGFDIKNINKENLKEQQITYDNLFNKHLELNLTLKHAEQPQYLSVDTSSQKVEELEAEKLVQNEENKMEENSSDHTSTSDKNSNNDNPMADSFI